MIRLTLTLEMTTAQVVKTSVCVNNNSPIQGLRSPGRSNSTTFEMIPASKPFHNENLCFTNLVQPELLCLKQLEHIYYAFRCIDWLAVTQNLMILTIWGIGKSPYGKQKRSKNYDVDHQNSLLYLLTSQFSLSNSFYYKPHRIHILPNFIPPGSLALPDFPGLFKFRTQNDFQNRG